MLRGTLDMNNRKLEQHKKLLIEKAEKLFGRIHPCQNKENFDECFTLTKDNGLIFWFNTACVYRKAQS